MVAKCKLASAPLELVVWVSPHSQHGFHSFHSFSNIASGGVGRGLLGRGTAGYLVAGCAGLNLMKNGTSVEYNVI